ncbi:polyprenyl diphosphate synthase [Candidatus Pelagibacter sp.]|nr:polyprenyl diphosphate synthase [Candidatus Pelagibacter sp.]
MNPLRHVAIIMDGNGRWGLKNKKNRNLGHKQGLKTIEKIVDQSIKREIEYLTLFTFSTENWKRPIREIKYLFSLLSKFLDDRILDLHKKNIKIKFIGTLKRLDNSLVKKILNSENLTKLNTKIQINIALNYGSKSEILNTMQLLKKKKLNFTLKNFEKNLFTKNIPNPDILIRTGNTRRLSNFLLWQLAYTEIFFEKKLWPDFNHRDFDNIILKYKNTDRNFGAI